jgi:ankyrin repeat protein
LIATQYKTVQDYLTSRTQVNARDTFGRTALYVATAYEHADVVRLLLVRLA